MRKRVWNVAGLMGMFFGRNTQRMPVWRSRCVSVHGIRSGCRSGRAGAWVCICRAVAEAEPVRRGARRTCRLMYCLVPWTSRSVVFQTWNTLREMPSVTHADRSPLCEDGLTCMPMTAFMAARASMG